MDKNEQQAKAAALLALSLKQGKSHGQSPCPDESDIAAYCDGRLSNDERQQFRTSIVQCPESYSLWMAMERHRNEWESATESAAEETSNLWQRFTLWLITPGHLTASAAAVASVMLVALLLRSGIHSPELSDSYEIAWAQPGVSVDFSMHSNGQTKGTAIFINPALKAFQEGAAIARRSMIEKSLTSTETCTNSLADCSDIADLYRYIGAWSVLMNISCQMDSNKLFENQQQLLGQWYVKWHEKKHSLAGSNGLDSRLEQLYKLMQDDRVGKLKICQAGDELLRFALR